MEDKFFWDKVDKRGPDECWPWIGSVSVEGYGRLQHRGKTVKATRYIYQRLNGILKPGLVVRHKCDNPVCVNPKHLIHGTHKDNIKDRVERGRSYLGDGNPNVKLTEQQVIAIRNDIRTHKEIAESYSISKGVVGKIRRHETWAHIKEGNKTLNPSPFKLTDQQVLGIRKDGRKLKYIAEEYGISVSTVSRIKNLIRRKNVIHS